MVKPRIISEEEAYKMTKKELASILKIRNVDVNSRDSEKILVEKILMSNPIEKEKTSDIEIGFYEKNTNTNYKGEQLCPRCQGVMKITGGGHSGTDFECIICKFKLSKRV